LINTKQEVQKMKMKETRHIEIRTEQSKTDEMVLIGTPVVFNTPTTINDPMGSFTEVIQRNAFEGVDLNDTRLLVNHDYNSIPLAKTPKTMELWTDEKGLNMRAVLPNTEHARSVFTAVERGTMTGMSFSFTCDSDGQSYDVEKRTRTISRINKLYECSIVNFPAYQTASVEARNQMQEAEQEEKRKEQAKIKINQLLKRGL